MADRLTEIAARAAAAYEPLSPENRAALADLIGDTARPAGPDFLLRLGHTVKDCRTHDHEAGEDIFCGNLHGWMGERMALVVRRLLDAEAELERRSARAETCGSDLGPGYTCQRPARHDGDCEPTPDTAAEAAELREQLDAYEVMNPQQCQASKHADWLVDSEHTHTCPWCEIERLRAELEKYVGKEPTRDEEAQHVNRCLNAVYDACEAARRDGRVLTVEEIEQAADGNRPGARKTLTETLAELASRAHRVAGSHQRFIEDHSDPGTDALCAQYELAQALIRIEEKGKREPGAEPDIPWATARHVLWTFGEDGGMRPGSFTQQLIDTCARADVMHLARLAQAYPAEAHAVHLAKNTEDGITRLQVIAGGAA